MKPFTFVFLCFQLPVLLEAFTIQSAIRHPSSSFAQSNVCYKTGSSTLYSKGFEDEDDDLNNPKSSAVATAVTAEEMVDRVRNAPKPNSVSSEEITSDYPIDVPSPILLAGSMVLAISSTGSIFELSGGHPVLGFIPTATITLLGIPSCFFLFYASIKKGIAETEEDDKAFQKKNGRF
jgi:hypothetical protein